MRSRPPITISLTAAVCPYCDAKEPCEHYCGDEQHGGITYYVFGHDPTKEHAL